MFHKRGKSCSINAILNVSKKPILLLGLGLFLPHGENVCGDLQLTGTVKNSINDEYINAIEL